MAAKPKKDDKPTEIPSEDEDEEDGNKPENPLIVHKCLEMIYQLMQDATIKTLNPTLLTICEELVLPSIRNLEPEIHKSAVKVMGVCSIRSIDVARQHLIILLQVF